MKPIFACPSAGKSSFQWRQEWPHYAINLYGFAGWDGLPKTVSIRNPTGRMMFMDVNKRIDGNQGDWLSYVDRCGNLDDWLVNDSVNAFKDLSLWKHRNKVGANMAFLDGHAESRSMLQIPRIGYCWMDPALDVNFWSGCHDNHAGGDWGANIYMGL